MTDKNADCQLLARYGAELPAIHHTLELGVNRSTAQGGYRIGPLKEIDESFQVSMSGR